MYNSSTAPVKPRMAQSISPFQTKPSLAVTAGWLLPNDFKLLLVDDSALTQEILEHTFQELIATHNVQVLHAYNGQMGLRLMLAQRPTIVIFDLCMPVMGGLEMLEALHQHPAYYREGYQPHLIALTSQDNLALIERALALGVEQYYTKPFDSEALLQRIYHLLDNSLSVAELHGKLGDLLLKYSQLQAQHDQALGSLYNTELTARNMIDLLTVLQLNFDLLLTTGGAAKPDQMAGTEMDKSATTAIQQSIEGLTRIASLLKSY